jgi:5-methylcytosine-specific restriction endonuclease McrA
LTVDGKLPCAYCLRDCLLRFEFEHFIPLKKGGANTVGNLRLVCPSCNRRKSARLPLTLFGETR